MILDPEALSICESSILQLTGERIARGDTGWLQVMARALSMGAAYKALWENKHGKVHGQPPTGDNPTPDD